MKTYTINLTEREMQTVIAGLGELPMKVSGQVVASITLQIQAQAKEAHDAERVESLEGQA